MKKFILRIRNVKVRVISRVLQLWFFSSSIKMVIDWFVIVDCFQSNPRKEKWSGKQFWEWIWWRNEGSRAVVLRKEFRILVPPDGRHRLKTRIIELPAVPRSSISEERPVVDIAVEAVMHTVTLGTADQLVHVTG